MKRAQRWVVICSCSYEVLSLTGRRTPTLTELCLRYPKLRLVLVGSLAVHLYRRQA